MNAEKPRPNRHEEKIKNLVDNVLKGPGHSDPQLRQAVAQKVAAHAGRTSENDVSVHEALDTYVDKIALYAYKITTADVDALRDAGFSENVIFELTLSAALGAGMARLKSGITALKGGDDAA